MHHKIKLNGRLVKGSETDSRKQIGERQGFMEDKGVYRADTWSKIISRTVPHSIYTPVYIEKEVEFCSIHVSRRG